MSDMKRYNALTKVTAKPMTRQAYNDLRGWELLVDECGSDDGYLTVDINADSNFDGYDGHVSWKPKALFDDQFHEVDDDEDDAVQYADDTSVCGYGVSGSTRQGLSLDQELMRDTISLISHKYAACHTDQMLEDANKIVSAIMGCDSQVEAVADSFAKPDEVMAGGVSLVPCESAQGEQVGFLDSAQTKNATISANSSACVVDGFGFGAAIHYLKAGEKVMRAGWNGKGMFLYYVPAASYPMQRNSLETMGGVFPDDMVPYGAYIAMKTAQDNVVPWLASQTDVLAEDWQLA